ncbi:hypothetical protein GCM10027610_018710 [Dactylosporangium cerinum]
MQGGGERVRHVLQHEPDRVGPPVRAAQAGRRGVLAVAQLPRGVQDPAGQVRVDRDAVKNPGDRGQADPGKGGDVLHRGPHMNIHI